MRFFTQTQVENSQINCSQTQKDGTDPIFMHPYLTSIEVKFIVCTRLFHFVCLAFFWILHVIFIDSCWWIFVTNSVCCAYMQNEEMNLKANHAVAWIDKICTFLWKYVIALVKSAKYWFFANLHLQATKHVTNSSQRYQREMVFMYAIQQEFSQYSLKSCSLHRNDAFIFMSLR